MAYYFLYTKNKVVVVDMFHVSQEKTYFVCYSLPDAPVCTSAIFPDHFIPANHNRTIDKQNPIKSNEQRTERTISIFVWLSHDILQIF